MATIKISKSQWDAIGQKTGWNKMAQSVEKIITPETATKQHEEWEAKEPKRKAVSREVVFRKLSPQGKKNYEEMVAIKKQIEKLKQKVEQNLSDLSYEVENMEIEHNFSHAQNPLAEFQDEWNEWVGGLGIHQYN